MTDDWLIYALDFFRLHRNELVHDGKTDDIYRAIDVERSALARLKEIQRKKLEV